MLKVDVPGEYLTVQEASDILGIHPKTVVQRMDAGKLPFIQDTMGQKTRYTKRSDVEEMANAEKAIVDSLWIG